MVINLLAPVRPGSDSLLTPLSFRKIFKKNRNLIGVWIFDAYMAIFCNVQSKKIYMNSLQPSPSSGFARHSKKYPRRGGEAVRAQHGHQLISSCPTRSRPVAISAFVQKNIQKKIGISQVFGFSIRIWLVFVMSRSKKST